MKFEEIIEGLRNGKHYGRIAGKTDPVPYFCGVYIGIFVDSDGIVGHSTDGYYWGEEPGVLTLEDLQAEWQEIHSVLDWKEK